jgi:hypothetical protein
MIQVTLSNSGLSSTRRSSAASLQHWHKYSTNQQRSAAGHAQQQQPQQHATQQRSEPAALAQATQHASSSWKTQVTLDY